MTQILRGWDVGSEKSMCIAFLGPPLRLRNQESLIKNMCWVLCFNRAGEYYLKTHIGLRLLQVCQRHLFILVSGKDITEPASDLQLLIL